MMMDREETSEELHQTSGKDSVKSTPMQERTPTVTAPPTSVHNVPLFASLHETCRFANIVNQSERTLEATLAPAVAGSVT